MHFLKSRLALQDCYNRCRIELLLCCTLRILPTTSHWRKQTVLAGVKLYWLMTHMLVAFGKIDIIHAMKTIIPLNYCVR